VSSDYIGLTSVDIGIIGGLLLSGNIVGTSIGALLGVGLTPRDNRRTEPPARRLTDLVSPTIVAVTFTPILAWLGCSIYCAARFPVRQTAEPLLGALPWLPYAGPAFMAIAFVFANKCA